MATTDSAGQVLERLRGDVMRPLSVRGRFTMPSRDALHLDSGLAAFARWSCKSRKSFGSEEGDGVRPRLTLIHGKSRGATPDCT